MRTLATPKLAMRMLLRNAETDGWAYGRSPASIESRRAGSNVKAPSIAGKDHFGKKRIPKLAPQRSAGPVQFPFCSYAQQLRTTRAFMKREKT